jgi:hypothetical protein
MGTVLLSARTTPSLARFSLLSQFRFSLAKNSTGSGAMPASQQRPESWRTCSLRKNGALQAMKVFTKAQYNNVDGDVQKIGVFVAGSNGIVFENFPCPHQRTQLWALFYILVPCVRG